MTVTNVRTDTQALRLGIDAEFDAPVERVWQLWADPRQLEQWWGPPTYPATFTRHDLSPGSRVNYHMTGPEGDQVHAYWDVQEVDDPHELVLLDGFADADGTPTHDLPPQRMQVTIAEVDDGRTRMTVETTFADLDAMEQLQAMGMEEGLTLALGQIDALLADDTATTTTGFRR